VLDSTTGLRPFEGLGPFLSLNSHLFNLYLFLLSIFKYKLINDYLVIKNFIHI
jgi:hypothetical protein